MELTTDRLHGTGKKGDTLRGMARLGVLAADAVPQAIDPNSFRWIDDLGAKLQQQGEKYPADPRFRNDLFVNLTEMAASLVTSLGVGKALSATGAASQAASTAAAFGVGGGESGAEQAENLGRPELATQQFLLHGALNAAAGAQFPQAPQILQASAKPLGEIAKGAFHGAGTVAAIQAGSNVASQPVTGNANLMEGVPTAALSGGVLSGAMAAAPHLMAGRPETYRENVSMPWDGAQPPPLPEIPNRPMNVVKVDLSKIPLGPAKAMRERAWDLADSEGVFGRHTNAETGWRIRVDQESFNHGFSNKGLQNIVAAPSLPEMIREATLHSSAHHDPPSPEFGLVHTMYAPVDLNGTLFRAKLTVKEHVVNGMKVYDHKLTEIEPMGEMKEPDGISQAAPSQELDAGPASGSRMDRSTLLSGVKGAVSEKTADTLRRLGEVEQELRFGSPDPARIAELTQEREGLHTRLGVIPGGHPPEAPGGADPAGNLSGALGVQPPPPGKSASEQLQKLWDDNSKLGIVAPTPPGLSRVVGGVKKLGSVLREMGGAPKWNGFKVSLLKWNGTLQRSAIRQRQIMARIDQLVPDPVRQEGITNWIQAEGDRSVLKERMEATTNHNLRKGYAAALDLTPQEITVADSVSLYFTEAGARAKSHGLIKEALDNYVTQIWSDFKQSPTLTQNLKFGRQRTYDSFFDGEQAGMKPLTKRISEIVAIHMGEIEKVVATRQLIKDLTTKEASDGRPLAAPTGVGNLVDPVASGQPSSLFINPHARGSEIGDYKAVNNPALSKWIWAGQAPDGTPSYLKGDLVLHPEIYHHVKNVLGQSAFKEWMNSPGSGMMDLVKGTARGLETAQSFYKQTMLSMSPFHYVQEGTHAIGHRVNPFGDLPKLNPDDPAQARAMDHGLVLSGDRHQMDLFSEGLAGGPVTYKIPWLGSHVLKPMTEFLFHEYIPRLKLKTYNHILERNSARYGGDIASGKTSIDQVELLSARQANAAYGHLNYVEMGRNPTIQHVMRSIMLAPDFLEARARFTGQALAGFAGAKAGREQAAALAMLAGTFYLTARIFNKALDGDYHLDPQHLFSVVHDGREYKMRSVPEDLYRLFADTHKFISGRVSPLIGKTAMWAVTGRNYRGETMGFSDEFKELATGWVPISMQPMLGLKNRQAVNGWENLVSSMGLQISRYSPAFAVLDQAKEWMKAQGMPERTGVYPISKYQGLRQALEDNDSARARTAWLELKASDKNTSKLTDGFRQSIHKPFTESSAMDRRFRSSLSEPDRARFDFAKERQREVFRRFLDIR